MKTPQVTPPWKTNCSAPASISPDDFATEQQIAKNHKRVAELTCPPVDDLFAADLAAEHAQRCAAYEETRKQILIDEAKRARGDDLPLFAL